VIAGEFIAFAPIVEAGSIDFARPKSSYFHRGVTYHPDVRGLQIPMDDPMPVRHFERVRDASALVKRYVAERGSRETRELSTKADVVATSLITRAEVAGGVPTQEVARGIEYFDKTSAVMGDEKVPVRISGHTVKLTATRVYRMDDVTLA